MACCFVARGWVWEGTPAQDACMSRATTASDDVALQVLNKNKKAIPAIL